MKPWLLNILACPIDKHHPLDAYIYSWETITEEQEKIQKKIGKPSSEYEKQYQQLVKQILDKTISPISIQSIIDLSESKYTKKIYEKATAALEKIISGDLTEEKTLLTNNLKEIDILFRYMNLLEINEGILYCPQCGRWYPIGSSVETIPELLPDELREIKNDLEFLKKWKGKVPEKVLKRGLPHTLN